MTIRYYLNNDKRSSLKEKAIFCYIRDGSKTLTLHTGERIEPKYWDLKSQKVKKGYIGHPQLNDFLEKYRENIKNIIRTARINEPLVSFDVLKNILLKEVKDLSDYDFIEVFEGFINIRKPIVSKATTVKFTTIKNQILDFAKKNKIKLTFDIIDLTFFDKLHNYFLTIGLSNNTIHKNMQFFRSFLRYAYDREYSKNKKFESFKNVKLVETDSIALTKDDVNQLINCNHLNDKLIKVRDLFLFQLYTGQRWSDISNLKNNDIKSNTWYLRQQKTKKIIEIPLAEAAVKILEKYGYMLPKISNQKMVLPRYSRDKTNLFF